MIEEALDLWEIACNARCVTTNGTVKSNGRAVMGRGCALQATQRFPFIQLTLGKRIEAEGLHVTLLLEPAQTPDGAALLAFPVKYVWSERADLELIKRSAIELLALIDGRGWDRVVLPRPGCGNGQRKWHEVKPILAPLLDDRFTVVTL